MTRIPLEEWFGTGGLSIISFPVEAEYVVLNQILGDLGEERMALIHSKPMHRDFKEYVTLIDATGHAPTARTTLRRRVGEYDNATLLDNPADVQGVLNQLGRIAGLVQVKWWLWWSPSDMVAQGLTDEEVARCMRTIAKDFSETRFLGLIAKDVHTQRGLATLKYVASTFIDITETAVERQRVQRWRIAKHPDTKLEGDEIEI